ncbi:MAG: response regulator [Lysobacterales bacterium]
MNERALATTANISTTAADPLPVQSITAGANLLLVDDVVANLTLLLDVLKDEGYQVRPVTDGRQALRAAKAQPPDLILLDIDMPTLDGFEVCKTLKRMPETQHIPVIFLSAFDQPTDKVAAFSAGGVDYVTKPFQIEEVLQRVSTHLHLESLKRSLEGRNQELQARNRELEKLRKTQANLVHMIVHDLRSPLAGVLGYLELLQIGGGDSLSRKIQDDVSSAVEACNSANDLVSSLLDIARLESSAMPLDIATFDLREVAFSALNTQHAVKGSRNFSVHHDDDPVLVSADSGLTHRVIVNLLQNAVRATNDNGRIDIEVSREGQHARLQVKDNGRGIHPDQLPKLFEKFAQADHRRQHRDSGFGIGLAFCRLAMESQQGSVDVESRPDEGSRFWITLPLEST